MIKQITTRLSLLSLMMIVAMPSHASVDFPVVESAALGIKENLPWSKPVQVQDPFEGDFVGVFDRNYFYDRLFNTQVQIEVQSLWRSDAVRFLLIVRDRNCSRRGFYFGIASHLGCSESNTLGHITELFVKLNGEIFQLSGQNSLFPIDQQLALALQNAPEKNVDIRLITQSGATIDSAIGKGTVDAWKTIYDTQTTLSSQ